MLLNPLMLILDLLVAEGRTVALWLKPQTPDPEVEGSSPTWVAVLCP